MIFSQRIYFIILTHILLILATSGTGIGLILLHKGVIIGSMLILCSLLQIGALTHQLNTFNRKIRVFFDTVEDKENMLCFPEQGGSKEQMLLNRSLNRINDLLAKAKAENRKQEHFYRSLLEEVPGGILAWEPVTGRIIVANSAALTLLGCNQLGNSEQLKSLLQNKDRMQYLSISERQLILGEKNIIILSLKDIGDELSDKESESWRKLTHVLTHEIMNTIAPITSLSQTLSTYPDMNEKAIRGLCIIQSQCERLTEFTESFRHLSYLPKPEKKVFSLIGLLHALEVLLQTDFEINHIAFSLHCSSSSIEIDGDENQFSQVFLNLLKNAMQALEGKAGGIIKVYIHQAERLLIEIEDNGSGIPAEVQEKIFIPFFTTKSEGSGIGLSLCKQIVRLHEGHLVLKESRPGKTIFSIDLPHSTSFV